MRLKGIGRGIQQLLGIVIVSSALAGCGGSSTDSSSTDSASSSATASTSATAASSTAMALVALSSSTYMVEPSSSAIVTIYRSGPSTGAATVAFSTINGSATAGADYAATTGSVTWQDGDTGAKTVIVPVTTAAAGKNFAIGLTNVQGEATFGSPASAVIQVAAMQSQAAVSSSSSSGGSSSSSGSSSSTVASNSGSSSGSSSSSSSGAIGTKTASLSWSAPVENTNGTALTNLSGYHIYYGTSTGAMTNKVSISTVGILSYVIDNMASGNWYFAVTSLNSAGVESALSNTIQATL